MPRATDIFEMLRQGRITEALPAARQMFDNEPDNVWNLRALIRTLCKAIWESSDQAAAQHLADELAQLPALPDGENDASLTDYRERAICRADPINQTLWEIRETANSGAHKEALDKLRSLHRDHPKRVEIDEAMAWEIWHAIVAVLRMEQPDGAQIRSLLVEYSTLKHAKPSVIHSRILDVVARTAHKDVFPKFCGFLKWWDATNLREEDFVSNPGRDGNNFPSVVEHTIQALGKTIKHESNATFITLGRDFIAKHYKRYPEQEWFPYYLAIALIRSGDRAEAKALLLPTVRKKQTESWAWQHLAECFATEEPERLTCLCKALLCGAREPQHLLPIHSELAKELLAAGYPNEARSQIDRIIKIRTENGWPIRGEWAETIKSEWYTKATPNDGMDIYRQLAVKSTDLLNSGLPWSKAVIGAKNVKIGEHRDRFVIVDVQKELGKILSIPVKTRSFELFNELHTGAPIAVQTAISQNRVLILSVRKREGQPWDIHDRIPALVLRTNPERGITTLLTADGKECLCHHDSIPDSASAILATVVSCAIVNDPSGIARIRHLMPHEGFLTSPFWKQFKGPFRSREQGGGHVVDIFLHARLSGEFVSGSNVAGIAVRQTDKATKRSWWVAISAETYA